MSEQRKKTVALAVRLEPGEAEAIREKAKDAGVTVSEFLRAAALGRKTRSVVEEGMINELRRLGGLQKMIHNDTGGTYSKETAAIHAEAFSTAETAPKGRYLGGPVTWGGFDEERVEALDLPFEVIHAGTDAALFAELESAYQRKAPVLLWIYAPHWAPAKYEGEWVEFPTYSPEWVKANLLEK